jgi:branched-chain amino acid transport system permease protein
VRVGVVLVGRLWRPAALAVGVAVVAFIPLAPIDVPVLFQSPLSSPGTLQLLAMLLIFGGVALTYDLQFGFTGLLSFGHALYFALGCYAVTVAVTRFHWDLVPAMALAALTGLVVAAVLGVTCLRARGIAFAMVTLAFGQALSIVVVDDPLHLSGGSVGLSLDARHLPAAFVGVFNTDNLYWLAAAYAGLVCLAAWWALRSSPGRFWRAVRDNELRVELMGVRALWFKLLAFVLSSFLCTLGGAVYAVVLGQATPDVTTTSFTLALLVMVVIGGAGTGWGAFLGGVLYTYLDNRLDQVATLPAITHLPPVLAVPLSQPLFILGAIFVLLVLFFPRGLAGLVLPARSSGVRRWLAGMVVPARGLR